MAHTSAGNGETARQQRMGPQKKSGQTSGFYRKKIDGPVSAALGFRSTFFDRNFGPSFRRGDPSIVGDGQEARREPKEGGRVEGDSLKSALRGENKKLAVQILLNASRN